MSTTPATEPSAGAGGDDLGNAMILGDQTAVPLTLPDILEDFHIGAAKASRS